jgi:hypothetical protein
MKYITWTRQEITDGQRRSGWLDQLSGMPGILMLAVLLGGMASTANAGPREQAKRMHDRLAGVPPSEAVLASMEADIDPGQNNNPLAAATTAMNNASFYNVTLKNFVAPWTNRDSNVRAIERLHCHRCRHDCDDAIQWPVLGRHPVYRHRVPGLPGYSSSNNVHYEQSRPMVTT